MRSFPSSPQKYHYKRQLGRGELSLSFVTWSLDIWYFVATRTTGQLASNDIGVLLPYGGAGESAQIKKNEG